MRSSLWNIFDFIVVAVCYMPFGGSSVAVLRLLRLLRVLKLLKALKQLQVGSAWSAPLNEASADAIHSRASAHAALQVIVNGLLMGLSEIAYLMLLMLIVFYFFAVIGLLFLKENDPQNFGDMYSRVRMGPTRVRTGPTRVRMGPTRGSQWSNSD
jgi:voltage-gated sodium channel